MQSYELCVNNIVFSQTESKSSYKQLLEQVVTNPLGNRWKFDVRGLENMPDYEVIKFLDSIGLCQTNRELRMSAAIICIGLIKSE